MTLRALVADTETTGAEAHDRIVEVAWFEIDENLTIIDQRHSLIDPCMPISATASGIHGITDEDVADSPTMDEFMAEILGPNHFAPDDEVLLIAHNAEFDKRHLKPYLPIADILCTLRLARRVWPTAENHKLATLMYLLKLERGISHRADGDVSTCLDLLRRIVRVTGKSLQQLYDEAQAPVWVEKVPFGKHRGSKLRDLPSSYIEWMLGRDNLDKDLRWSLGEVNRERFEALRK